MSKQTVYVVLDGAAENVKLVGVGSTRTVGDNLKREFLEDEFGYETDPEKRARLVERYGPMVHVIRAKVQDG